MGTNYYAETDAKPACPTCGHAETTPLLHIGKSSGGWRFGFAVELLPDGTALDSFSKWVTYLSRPGVAIVDEYGSKCSLAELLTVIEKKRDGWPHGENHAGYGWQYVPDSVHFRDEQGYDFTRCDFS